MSARTGLTSLLFPDGTSRTALNETLADWRDERARATSIPRRVWADMQGCLSVLRVLVGETAKELTAPAIWRMFGWTFVATVVVAALNPFSWAFAGSVTPGVPIGETLVLRALLVLNSLALAFALVSAAGAGQTSHERRPALAGVTLSFLFMLVMVGWLVPVTNHLLRGELSALDRQALARSYLTARVDAGSELPLQQLLAKAVVERNTAYGAQSIVSERLVLVLSAPIGFVLGIAIRRRLAGRTSWRVAQGAGAAALILAAIAGSYAWPLLNPLLPWLVAVRLDRLNAASWLGLAFACVAVCVLARSSNSASGAKA